MTIIVFKYRKGKMGIRADAVDRCIPDGTCKELRVFDINTIVGEVPVGHVKSLLICLKDRKIALRIDELLDIAEVEEHQFFMLPPLVRQHMNRVLESRVIYKEKEQVMLLVDPNRIPAR